METWKPFPSAPDFEISDLGNVRSWDSSQPLPVKVSPHGRGGYLTAIFRSNGKKRYMLVHRAVLIAFGGPPPTDKPLARHLDGNKANVAFSNLAWGDYVDNIIDALRHGTKVVRPGRGPCKTIRRLYGEDAILAHKKGNGNGILRGEQRVTAKLTDEKVRTILSLRGSLSRRQLASRFGVSESLISHIYAGSSWRHVTAAVAGGA